MKSPLIETAWADTPIFDGHNDLPWAVRQRNDADFDLSHLSSHQAWLHTDIPRLQAGRVGAQFWSVFVPSNLSPSDAVVATLEQIDYVYRMTAHHTTVFDLVHTGEGVRKALAAGKIASLMGIEGGHSIDSSLGVLRMMRRAGVRYMTLTHNDNTPWARSATGHAVGYGLTPFGVEVVREMNRIGMIVDLSHVAEQTMHDALNAAQAPVMFSHSSCRAVTDHPRNVPDSVLERIPANNGVIMVTFVPQFISEACADYERRSEAMRLELELSTGYHLVPVEEAPKALAEFALWESRNEPPEASILDVIRHLEHAREVAGPAHVGIGSDFDGIERLPRGLTSVSSYPALLNALADRGWSRSDIQAVAYENALRVLEQTEEEADVEFSGHLGSPGWSSGSGATND